MESSAISRFLQCETLQDFVDCSMELIGNPMMILDMNMQVAACSSVDVPDETCRLMESPALRGSRGVYMIFNIPSCLRH